MKAVLSLILLIGVLIPGGIFLYKRARSRFRDIMQGIHALHQQVSMIQQQVDKLQGQVQEQIDRLQRQVSGIEKHIFLEKIAAVVVRAREENVLDERTFKKVWDIIGEFKAGSIENNDSQTYKKQMEGALLITTKEV